MNRIVLYFRITSEDEITNVNFLRQRWHKRCIVVNTNVLSGVPQGSVLGPLLFLMFVNELPLWIQNEMRMFADDTKIWCKIKTENDGTTLQEDLDNLSSWSEIWQLKFNAEKCISVIPAEQKYYMTKGILGKRKLESVQERDLVLIIR